MNLVKQEGKDVRIQKICAYNNQYQINQAQKTKTKNPILQTKATIGFGMELDLNSTTEKYIRKFLSTIASLKSSNVLQESEIEPGVKKIMDTLSGWNTPEKWLARFQKQTKPGEKFNPKDIQEYDFLKIPITNDSLLFYVTRHLTKITIGDYPCSRPMYGIGESEKTNVIDAIIDAFDKALDNYVSYKIDDSNFEEV